jgi:hypothetical protein
MELYGVPTRSSIRNRQNRRIMEKVDITPEEPPSVQWFSGFYKIARAIQAYAYRETHLCFQFREAILIRV